MLERSHIFKAVPCALSQLCHDCSSDELIHTPVFDMFFTAICPSVSVSDYFARLYRYGQCSEFCFLLTLIYIERLHLKYPSMRIDKHNIHRLVLASFVVACKYHEDDYHTNSTYAQIGGVSNLEMNELECTFLCLLGFELGVGDKEFDDFQKRLGDCSTRDLCLCSQKSQRQVSAPVSAHPFSCEKEKAKELAVLPIKLGDFDATNPYQTVARTRVQLNTHFLNHFNGYVQHNQGWRDCNLSKVVTEYFAVSAQINGCPFQQPFDEAKLLNELDGSPTWEDLNLSFLQEMEQSDLTQDWSHAASQYLSFARQLGKFLTDAMGEAANSSRSSYGDEDSEYSAELTDSSFSQASERSSPSAASHSWSSVISCK